MTKRELLMFTNSLLDGRSIDETTFQTFLNLFKMRVEMSRPWAKLRSEDSSETIEKSNTWETTHALPNKFSQPYPVKRNNGTYSALLLVSGTDYKPQTEIQWAQRVENQDVEGFFAIDYINDVYIITGTLNKSYTAYFSFIKFSEDLTDDSDTWVFPSQFHPLLGYGVAAMEKARDYDEVNLANIQLYQPEASAIIEAMQMWDTHIQKSMHNV